MAFKRQRMGRRKSLLFYKKTKITYIDYKDVDLLKKICFG